MGSFTQSGTALEWRGGHETVRIEPWGRNSLRIRGTLWQAIQDDLPGALLAAPSADADIQVAADQATITNGGLTAEISGSGQLRFLGAGGRELLSETTPHFTGPPTRRYATTGGGTHHFEVLFNARDGERFYGLGQHQHGLLNQKGAVVELVQRNTEVSIPFLVSNLGYGLLWNHPGVGRVELGVTRHEMGIRGHPAVGLLDHRRRRSRRPAPPVRRGGGAHADAAGVGLGLLAVQAPLQDPG